MYIDGWIVYYMAFSVPPLDLQKAGLVPEKARIHIHGPYMDPNGGL